MIRDSKLDPNFIRENMRLNPPCLRPNGIIFSGPVRLSFPNLFRPGKPSQAGAEGKYGATLLFPPGTDMGLFSKIWIEEARKAFPSNWDERGNPIGLHIPFHDQVEKSVGAKPLAGYTPGGVSLAVSSKYKPTIVDSSQNLLIDEARVYPGVWAFVGLNYYSYGVSPPQPKKGIGFGLQTVMIIADDVKLAGGGGDPTKDFAGVQLTAQSNIAARFDGVPQTAQPQGGGIMPGQGHVGTAGTLPTQPVDDVSSLM